MDILVINAGSSSLKYQLIDTDNQEVLAKGQCERIGIDGKIQHKTADKSYEADFTMHTHADAIKEVIRLLISDDYGVISDMKDIQAIGHRVVHGGDAFTASTVVDDEVIAAIDECYPLDPLHTEGHLIGIRTCIEVMGKDVPQVVVFDTAFHQTMPAKAFLYAVPYQYYKEYKIRRYGFHGTSHRYVSDKAAKLLGKPIEQLKIITCHLGNGSSITAVNGGKSVDTSMGLTPLDGVPMGTRCGAIDPTIVEYLMDKTGMDVHECLDTLNKKSGVLGISGISSDFRDLDDAAAQGNKRAEVALDLFAYAVKKYIGAYAAVMNGVDAVVFTAGIGENNAALRKRIVADMDYLGMKLDQEKNQIRGKEQIISTDESTTKIMVIPTNEELVIALDTEKIVKNIKA